MSLRTYGVAPWDLGEIDVSLPEVMYYLYLPIKLAGSMGFVLPRNLRPLQSIVAAVIADHSHGEIRKGLANAETADYLRLRESYVYITVKKMFCSPSVTANRPGWHADGFGSDDLNYVWYDCLPTEFAIGSNFKITEGDHIKSLEEFDAQAQKNVLTIYPNKHLLKLDQFVVHRVAVAKEQLMRTFVKISVSKNPYNLKDNSINPDLDYIWKTYDRSMVRNDPATAQLDSYKPKPSNPEDDHFK